MYVYFVNSLSNRTHIDQSPAVAVAHRNKFLAVKLLVLATVLPECKADKPHGSGQLLQQQHVNTCGCHLDNIHRPLVLLGDVTFLDLVVQIT